MRESTIEAAVCSYAKSKGCLILKLSGQNQRGQPDRMFLFDERVLFLEFKSPSKQLTVLQARWLDRLTHNGFHASSCDNIDNGKLLIDILTAHVTWN